MYLYLGQSENAPAGRPLALSILALHAVLLWTHTTIAQVPEVSPNEHVSIWYPVAYSNGSLLTFNAIDTVVVSWDTSWQEATVGMWCLTNETTNSYTGQDLDSPRELHYIFRISEPADSLLRSPNWELSGPQSQ